ncbi:MAG: DUF4351 domain-containing protein [Pseudohongiellaceae bacterium]
MYSYSDSLINRGRAKGKAEAFDRLMKRKFGSLSQGVEKQIEQASPEQIESWLDKILTAQSPEDIFPATQS